MDFVFGTYINDRLKLANHRAARTGIQHQFRISPLDPTPDDPITVHLVTSYDTGVNRAALYFTTDETEPEGKRGLATQGEAIAFERVRTEWDSLTWGYLSHWQATLPPQPEGTLLRYRISAWDENSASDDVYADWPNAEASVQHEAMLHFENIPPGTPFQPGEAAPGQVFNVLIDRSAPPDWAADAVIYHIFIDRFYPGDGADWVQTDDLSDFVGGTLWGVRDKLDYVVELGANVIWLSPLWASPTAHGYDTSDFSRVQPQLGGDEALRAVVEAAHQRSIRVILDMACNHISNEHPFFVEARNDPNSPYRDWFFFDEAAEHGYVGFFNVPTMPEVNLEHPDARAWMIDNAVRWLRDFDVDGYRLDFANGPGPGFWSYFRRACKTVKPDCFLYGEIIDAPDKLCLYTGRLDGCLDFTINDALRRTYAWRTWTATELEAFFVHHADFFPSRFIMPTFIDNHDMDRFGFIVKEDREAMRQVARRQLQHPNPPVIYYGNEIGLRQQHGTREHSLNASRVPMLWDESQQDRDLLSLYQTLIRARQS